MLATQHEYGWKCTFISGYTDVVICDGYADYDELEMGNRIEFMGVCTQHNSQIHI